MHNKKMIALTMAVTMSVALTACSGGANTVETPVQEEVVETEVQEEETEVQQTEADNEQQVEAGSEQQADAGSEQQADAGSEAGAELMDYMGKSSDELAAQFPNLESNDSQYWGTEELMADGLEMAGPFFDVDGSSVITGITYGGSKYSVLGITPGMDMQEAAGVLKADGWEFSMLEIAHGTCQYVAIYTKADMQAVLISDTEGEFSEDQESDIKGNVAKVSVSPIS